MRGFGSVIAAAWYVVGLVLLWNAGHWVWMVFGVFLPVIPWVYVVARVVEKLS